MSSLVLSKVVTVGKGFVTLVTLKDFLCSVN